MEMNELFYGTRVLTGILKRLNTKHAFDYKTQYSNDYFGKRLSDLTRISIINFISNDLSNNKKIIKI